MIAALLLSLSALAAPEGAAAPEESAPVEASAVHASLVLAVEQREASADRLVAGAEALGGYFSSRTLDALTLRVPAGATEDLLALAEAEGLVTARDYTRRDLGAQLAEQQATLDSRREMLAQYFEVLAGAGADSVVTVEREITRLIAEIEQLEGALRAARNQAAYATVDIAFQFRDRAAPARDGSSSFAWLNTLNLADLLYDFQYGTRGEGPRYWGHPATPEGFSAYRGGREHRAVSPDEVVFRVRAVRHDPPADLSFWTEAVRVRMEEAGYRLVREEVLSAGGVPGGLIELSAPYGQTDYSYLIAFFPAGRRLVIAEAAGAITDFEARRDAVRSAILELTP